jgi:hypothetical protein
MLSALSENKTKVTSSNLLSSFRNSFTVFRAILAAFSMGYRYAPVLIEGKAIVFSPLDAAIFSEF